VRTVMTDNVDEVAAVSKWDRFTEPAGISIWQPENGPVIRLAPRFRTITAQSNMAKSMLVGNSIAASKVELSEAIVSSGTQDKMAFHWQLKEPLKSGNGLFLVQEEREDGAFSTLARVDAAAATTDYKINLAVAGAGISYRLVYTHPGRQSVVFAIEQEKSALTSYTAPTADKTTAEHSLRPDPKSGYLRVRYKLENSSDVDIKLVERGQAIVASKYQNQRKGNYLKSIDMSDYPDGEYRLVISINEQVFQEYQVTK